MASESIYKQHTPSSGGGDFLKLKDGDKVQIRLTTDPAISVYKQGDRPRYSWVVFNRGTKQPQIYSAGVSVYNAIADMFDEWGDPTTFDITIKRTGSSIQDTSYSVLPVKTSPDLTNEQVEECDKIDLVKIIKGKWLVDYIKDNKLPAPIMGEQVPEFIDSDAPIAVEDIPF